MIEDFKRAMAEKDIPEARRIAQEAPEHSGLSLESTVRHRLGDCGERQRT